MALNAFARWLQSLLQQNRKATPLRKQTKKKKPRLDLETLETRLTPATKIWDGHLDSTPVTPTGSISWTTGANWQGDVAPLAGDDLVFPTGAFMVTNTNNYAAGTIFNSIGFSGSGYTLSGNRIVLGSANSTATASIFTNAAGNNTINFDISLGGTPGNPQVFQVNPTASNLTLNGRLLDLASNPSVEVTKDGTGTLIVSGNNNLYTGNVTIQQGILRIQHANALGDGNHTTTVKANAQIQTDSVVGAINEHLILNGPGVASSGALLAFQGCSTWAGSIDLDTGTAVFIGATAGSSVEITGQINDTGAGQSLTKVGTGEVVLSPDPTLFPLGNTYRGVTTVNQGTLTVTQAGALGAAGATANGTVVNNFPSLSPGTLKIVSSAGITIANEFLTINGPGIYNTTYLNNSGAFYNAVGNNTWTGNVTLGSLPPNNANGAANGTIGNSSIGAEAGTNLTISGIINNANGNNDFYKVGPGRVILTATNTYTSRTFVVAGSLNIRASAALGSTSNGTTVLWGGTLETEGNLAPSEVLTLNGPGAYTNASTHLAVGALYSLTGRTTWNGVVNIGADGAFIGQTADTGTTYATPVNGLTLAGQVRGAGLFTKVGAGEVILGTNNTYTGGTDVLQGTLTVVANNSLGGRINAVGDAAQPYTTVYQGAALDIRPAVGFNLSIPANLRLFGHGVNSTYAFLNQQGALVNLRGNNTLTGDIQLGGQVGIGVQQIVTTPPTATSFSGLTIQGQIKNAQVGATIALPTSGLVAEQHFFIPSVMGNVSGSADVTWNFFPDNVNVNYGGIQVFGSGPNPFPGTTTVPYAGTDGFIEVVVNQGNLSWSPTVWTASVTQANATISGGIDKLGPNRLIIEGDGTYTGDVNVQAGVLRIKSDTALGYPNASIATGGTTMSPGTALEIDNTNSSLAGGITRGLQVSYETLHLQSQGYNDTTGQLNSNLPIPAVSVLGGLDTLWRGPVSLENSSIPFVIGGTARLQLDGNVTGSGGLVKQGSGELVLAGSGSSYTGLTDIQQGVVTVQSSQGLGSAANGTIVAANASLQLQGDITIAGEALTLQGTGANLTSTNAWFAQGPAPISNGITPGNLPTSGRIDEVVVDPSDPNVIYIAASGGGAWKTKNGGVTWVPLMDNIPGLADNLQTLVVSSIAIAPTDPRVIYVGTGEDFNASDSIFGKGVFRSTDSGKTWTLLTEAGVNPLMGAVIERIAVDPGNANNIFVAANDQPTIRMNGTAGNAGIWRWNGTISDWFNMTANVTISNQTQSLYPANSAIIGNLTLPSTGKYTDVALIRLFNNNLRVVGAFSGDFSGNSPFGQASSGVYYTDNNMSLTPTWQPNMNVTSAGLANITLADITFPLPANATLPLPTTIPSLAAPSGYERFPLGGSSDIRLATNGNSLWALVSVPGVVPTVQIFRSDTFISNLTLVQPGEAWQQMVTPPQVNTPYYFPPNIDYSHAIHAVGNTLYLGGDGAVFSSSDGGLTAGNWTNISLDGSGIGPHLVQHGFAQQGANIVVAGDGGIFQYDPAGNAWASLNGNLQISQLQGVTVSPNNYHIGYVGALGNGILGYNADNPVANATYPWTLGDTGDGGSIKLDPNNPTTVYAVARDPITGLSTMRKSTSSGAPGSWVQLVETPSASTPVVVDSINTNRVLTESDGIIPFGISGLVESLDGGATWVSLTTTPVPAPAPVPGFRSIAVATFQGSYRADAAFPAATTPDKGASTYDPDTIYLIDGSGRLYLTKNHGLTWVSSRGPSLLLTDVVVDPRNRDYVYVSSNTLGGSKIWFSADAGLTWTDLTADLTVAGNKDFRIHTMALDPRNPNTIPAPTMVDLYIGTDSGVFKYDPNALTWNKFGTALPNVPVYDMVLSTSLNSLSVATYGRGMFNIRLDAQNPSPGALRAISGASVWTGPITLLGDTTISAEGTQSLLDGQSASQLTITGSISGNASITKEGWGRIVFSGGNSYVGNTTINSGVLAARNVAALGALTNNTTVSAGAALEIQANLNAGNIFLNGNGFSLNDHQTGALRNTSGNNVVNANIFLANGTPRSTTIVSTPNDPANVANRITIGMDSGSTLTINTPIQDVANGTPVTLVKELAGRLVLTGNNTFAGAFFVNQGIVELRNGSALGDPANGTTVSDGAQIQLFGNITIASEPLTLSGSGYIATGALYNFAGNNTWGGPITLTTVQAFSSTSNPVNQVSINVRNLADTLSLTGPIGQTPFTGRDALGNNVTFSNFGFNKIGPGTMVLGSNNTYNGNATISAGTVVAQRQNSLGPANSGITAVQPGGTLVLNDPNGVGFAVTNETLNLVGSNINTAIPGGAVRALSGNYSWSGNVNLQLPAANSTALVYKSVVDVGDNSALVLGGNVTGNLGNMQFEKTGNGMLEFAGLNNTFTGNNILSGGITQVDFRVGNITLNGGTLTSLGGTNVTIGRINTTNAGGIISPANATNPGGMNTGITNWNGNTTYFVNLNQNIALGFDVLRVTGALTMGTAALGNATLAGIGNLTIPIGSNLTIITMGSRVGNFKNPGNVLTTADGINYNIIYTATSVVLNRPRANSIANLTAIPNPQELGLNTTFQVTIQNTANATPTGNFTLAIDNVTQPGNISLVGGTANVSLPSSLSLGNHTIRAIYNGDAAYAPSNNNLTLTITPMSVAVNATANPASPSNTNQSIVISGNITPARTGFGTPNGTVRISEGNITLGNATLVGGNYTLTLPANSLNAGSHSFNITYLGAGNFKLGNTTLTQILVGASALNLSINGTLTFGNNQNIVAIVAPSGATIPTGNVTFLIDGSPIGGGNVSLDGTGRAVLPFPIPGGSHTVTAVYNGDAFFNPSFIGTSTTIARAATNTTITLASPPSPQDPGTPITFAANVTPTLAATVPTGTVTIFEGSVFLGTATVNNVGGIGSATITTSALLSAGTHVLTAQYTGDGNYNPSTSGSFSFVINLLPSNTVIATTNANSFFGQSVVSATVTGTGPTPTGTVRFTANGGAFTQNVALVGGVATFNPPLNVGVYTNMTAQYLGDPVYNTSLSGTSITQTVNQASSNTTLGSSNPGGVAGTNITATVLNANAPGVPPTGNVTFNVNGSNFTVPVNSSGVATLSPALTPAGSPYTITATYAGNSNILGSLSNTLNQAISAAPSSTTVVAIPAGGTYGQSITLSSTVNSNVPVVGNVTFYLDGVAQSPVVAVSGGVANLTIPLVAGGNHTIRADFNGGVYFTPSSSANGTLTITAANTIMTLSTPSNTTVVGQPVTFTAHLDNNSGTGVVPTGNVTFFINGVAQGSPVNVNAGNATFTTTSLLVGNQTVSAVFNANGNFNTSNGTLTETVLASPIIFSSIPSTVVSGAAFGVQVRILNNDGSLNTGFNGPVTIFIGSGPAGAVLSGTTSVNASGGIANFGALTLDRAASNYILSAKTPTISAVNSNALIVTANRLSVPVTPSVTPGTNFTLNVLALDATGNQASNANSATYGQVTIQMLSGPVGGTFTSNTGNMVNGAVSIANLKVSVAGTYKFRITFAGLVYDLTVTTAGTRRL